MIVEHPAATKWDSRYRDADPAQATPLDLLQRFSHLLPAEGDALDLACGLGANARFLAERGLAVAAWDISPVAIEKLAAFSGENGLTIDARVVDLCATPLPVEQFDVIVVGHFLERHLFPAIAAALRPGGLLFYQTFTRERVGGGGPSNPEFLLAANELRDAFAGLRLVHYLEEGLYGDTARGSRGIAQLIAARA